MIRIFNGKSRGLGGASDAIGMILDFGFREHIHEFPGAMLHVFLNLALHCDDKGFCFPSYTTIQRETGLTRSTISSTLDKLCELRIENCRVLIRYSEDGKPSNRYIIFPTAEEISRIEASLKIELVQKSNQTSLKIEPAGSLKIGLEVKPLEVNPLTETRDTRTSCAPASDPFNLLSSGEQEPDSQKSESGEKKKKNRPNLFQIAAALAHVTGMDLQKNKGRLFKEAAFYAETDVPRIQREYGAGGLWYTCDWRGLGGETPTLAHIRETWGNLKAPAKPKAGPARQKTVEEMGYTVA